VEIRSYRSVFDLERRIYRVDRIRLNPGGIPVRGIVYWLAILLGLTLAVRVPLLGGLLGVLPWYVRELALPAGGAALLALIRIEGRPFHLAAGALLRYALGPRQLAGMRPCHRPGRCWRVPELLLLPDGSDARLRRLRYRGPGAVRVTVAHERAVRRGAGRSLLTVREPACRAAPARGAVIALARGARLRVG
jgi:hypothetical protein